MARNKFDIDETLEAPFSFSHLKRSLVYIKPRAWKLILAMLMSMVASSCSLLGPILMKTAVDVAVPDKNIRLLLILSAILGSTLLVSVTLTTLRNLITAKVGQGIVFDIRQDLFEHLQKLPFTFYDSRPHGKILVRVIQYVNSVSDMLSNGIINFFLEIFNLIMIAVFMFQVNVLLALVVLSGLPVIATILMMIKPAQRKAWQSVSNKSSNMNAYVHESINGMRVTQIFTREQTNDDINLRLSLAYRSAWMRAMYISNLVWFSVQNMSQIVTAFVYITGVDWAGGIITFGTILAMGTYTARFWQPITNLANIYNNFINTIAYLERIFETIDEPVDIQDTPDARTLPPVVGRVQFNKVDFEYEAGIKILNDIMLDVKPGESVALVGPTGAGKSTVVSLLCRFYNLTSGEILVDGNDISQVTLESLRSQMGVMLQDSFIFSGSILDNIRYGRLDATEEEIIAAAKTVRADEFISQMPEQYMTEVKERGNRLSQGQKQLISFARTLLADPRILVLDEATSSIDTKTELLLQQGLDELLKNRTSFIIAHRLSTVKKCNRIIYIDHGSIVEMGSHRELMAKQGAYYTLYNSQLIS